MSFARKFRRSKQIAFKKIIDNHRRAEELKARQENAKRAESQAQSAQAQN